MKFTTVLSFILVIVGALNWLLVGSLNFDLVAFIFGYGSVLARSVYIIVGIASLWVIFFIFAYRPFKNVAK